VTQYTYSSGFSTVSSTLNKFSVSCFILWFPHPQIFSLSDQVLFWEMEKSPTVQGWEAIEVAARVGFCVWLRNVA
jgi:hypothetical protein